MKYTKTAVKTFLMVFLNINFRDSVCLKSLQAFVFAIAATFCESWIKSHEVAFDKPCYSSMDNPTIFCITSDMINTMLKSHLYFKNNETTYFLTLSCRRFLSHGNQSNDLQSKSMDLFLYDRDVRHERV